MSAQSPNTLPIHPSLMLAHGGVTPDSNHEIGELRNSKFQDDANSSHSHLDLISSSPRTPKRDVLDPFASTLDKLTLKTREYASSLDKLTLKTPEEEASYYVTHPKLKLCRSLTNNGFAKVELHNKTECDDDILLETIYDYLLDVIVSKHTEELLADDGFTTPTYVLRLSGIADTCPAAPLKANRKLRDIDLSICKKLDFS